MASNEMSHRMKQTGSTKMISATGSYRLALDGIYVSL